MPKQLLFDDLARAKMLQGVEKLANAVAVGDEVIYGKYCGTDIEISGDDVKILRESDILAKVVD